MQLEIILLFFDNTVFEKYQRTETPYQKYLEDYFALDYSEYGYKYRNVVANDYGLKPDEVSGKVN